MSHVLLLLTPVAAILNWVAVETRNKPLEIAAKPAVILFLFFWLWSLTGLKSIALFFGVGLLFSLAGDIFLLLPRQQFLLGLLSFLIAHLFYIAGFSTSFPPISLPVFILAAMIVLAGGEVLRRVRASLLAGGNKRLVLPIVIYSLIIGMMLLSALMTLVNETWSAGAALSASAGALLFFISDSLLAWNKFVEPVKRGRLAVMITYHLGQALITIGVVNYLNG